MKYTGRKDNITYGSPSDDELIEYENDDYYEDDASEIGEKVRMIQDRGDADMSGGDGSSSGGGKKRNAKRDRVRNIIGLVLLILEALLTIVFIAMIINLDVLPTKWLVIMVGILVAVLLVVLLSQLIKRKQPGKFQMAGLIIALLM